MDEDAKQEYFSLGEEDLPQVTPGEDEHLPYCWDDKDDDAGSSFRVNALSRDGVLHKKKSHSNA